MILDASEVNICFDNDPMDDEFVQTITSVEQKETELKCLNAYRAFASGFAGEDDFPLWKKKTVQWLHVMLKNLSPRFQGMYSSQAWICYWCLHSLDLLDGFRDTSLVFFQDMVTLLLAMQNPDGGFGGGPKQESHLLATYAAVNALFICGAHGGDEVMKRVTAGIDIPNLRAFYLRMKVRQGPNIGAFTVHEDGEVDTRGMYCLFSIASLLNIIDDELVHGSAEWLTRCQGFDGGIGGEPCNEPHGGYSFCGAAAALLLKKPECLNLEGLLKWASRRQMSLEGGFAGRTNKLVDGCYSFWVGGIFPILFECKKLLGAEHPGHLKNLDMFREVATPAAQLGWLFNQRALQQYSLCCCQSSQELPGLMDKPGAGVDFYHTCYCLSGLSVAQTSPADNQNHSTSSYILGSSTNQLVPNNYVHNLTEFTLQKILKSFNNTL